MGSDDPAVDAELIQVFIEIERRADVRHTRLELNSIGDRECRPAYVERLRAFLADRRDDLDEDTRRRADVSPLRVFDTKSEAVRRVLAEAPTIGESLCERLPRALRGGAAASSTPTGSATSSSRRSCAGSTTTRAPCSSS